MSAFPSAGRRTRESIAPAAHERGLVSLPLAGGACQVADHRGESDLRFLLGCEEHLLLEDSILEEKRAAEGLHIRTTPFGARTYFVKEVRAHPTFPAHHKHHIFSSEDGTLDAYSEIVFFNCSQHENTQP